MNANPHTCAHHALTYDGTFAIVRCLECDTVWDADEPVPVAKRAPYPMCRTPQLCAGKGYCPHDIACNN